MHRTARLRWPMAGLTRRRQIPSAPVRVRDSARPVLLPLYASANGLPWPCHRPVHHGLHESRSESIDTANNAATRRLPLQCPGCGAFTQSSFPGEAGYYDVSRGSVKAYLGTAESKAPRQESQEDKVIHESLSRLPSHEMEELGLSASTLLSMRVEGVGDAMRKKTPPCDRCHALVHHNQGVSIAHPTMNAIREMIWESPHKYNHIYHLIDAADFPMSLIPRLHQLVGDIRLRSQNRRANADGSFHRDKKMEMSFVITRSDVLAPTKIQVDSLLPYFREVLRTALGRFGRSVRLGNVYLVSAHRGWWTRQLKEDIYERGGAAWMVGKVNVGKSSLFESVFPKGRDGTVTEEGPGHDQGPDTAPTPAPNTSLTPEARDGDHDGACQTQDIASADVPEVSLADLGHLLPPPRPETAYPEMPIVSSLPGTTASPIRVPFGKGKGEVIDLPGLERNSLDKHVQEAHRHRLLLEHRIKPDQQSIKPGQSFLLGGFIRITPKTENCVFLAANFTPLKGHVTSTEKAISIQSQEGTVAVDNISVPGVAESWRLAGTFALSSDMTRQRAGPLTRRNAVGLKPERLPFRVLAVDILVEGVGWVEVAVQVRTRDYPHDACGQSSDPFARLEEAASPGPSRGPKVSWPEVEVYTPEGRFVGERPPMNGYMLNKSNKPKLARPRRSMKGEKKRIKMRRRLQELSSSSSSGEVEPRRLI